jgi:hypothetical protein
MILGLAVAIVPILVYQTYEAMPDMEMKCLFTARLEIAAGAGIAALGALYFLFRSAAKRLVVSVLIAAAAALSLLLPTEFTGLCESAHMPCHMITLPVLTVTAVLLFVLAAAGGYFAYGGYRAQAESVQEK